jgi:hypothetical protein
VTICVMRPSFSSAMQPSPSAMQPPLVADAQIALMILSGVSSPMASQSLYSSPVSAAMHAVLNPDSGSLVTPSLKDWRIEVTLSGAAPGGHLSEYFFTSAAEHSGGSVVGNGSVSVGTAGESVRLGGRMSQQAPFACFARGSRTHSRPAHP